MNKEIKVLNDKMNTLQFAELTGTKHCDVLRKTRKLLNDLGIESTQFCVHYKDTRNRNKVMLELDRDLSLTLAGQYEPKIAYTVAKAFNKPQPPAPWERPPVQKLIGNSEEGHYAVLRMMAEDFNVTGTEKIKMFSTGLAQYPNLVKALPSYNSSKFVGTVGEVSERVAHAYSYHKKVYGFELSAVAFNRLLIANGLLHNETSSSGKVFKSIVGEGLEYGKNVSPKQNSTQTQPHWYDDTIEDLYAAITGLGLHSIE